MLAKRVAPRGRQIGRPEHAQTIRAVFEEAAGGYAAVDRLRAIGVQIDLAGSISGDLIVSIRARQTRFDEIAALVAAHRGRIEIQRGTTPG